MATSSDDNKPQNPATEVVKPATQAGEVSKMEPVKESSPTSVFVNSEPIREEQVQNAVKFLSHPKVRGSPVMYRRSFLERKGLTKEEIDEAFRRVPDPTPSISTPPEAVADGQQKSSSNAQTSGAIQTLQPAASLAKRSIIPKFKSWIHKVILEEEEEGLLKKNSLKPSLAEEAAAAAKSAAAAAADVARASQEMLISKTEEKRYFEELTRILDVQVREMKSMSNTIQRLEGNTSRNVHAVEQVDYRPFIPTSRQSSGKVDVDSRSARSLSPPASVEPSVPPHPKSYMEIMAMVQRGEKPPNIRDINDMPPNPNQPIPNPQAAPKPKPWEVGQTQYTTTNGFQPQEGSNQFYGEYQDNQLNGNNSASWLQQRNVRISEIETEDEQKVGSSGMVTNERPVQRSWVPPQPPPVAMPEAAAAIRQPKKPVVQKEQLNDDQLLARPLHISDALQRITRISEAGGAVEAHGGSTGHSEAGGVVEANGGSTGHSTSEIQNEESSHLEA